MKDASEIVHYDTAGIPLYVKSDVLSEYPGMRAICHWHDDLEFIRIRKGEMYYRVNSQTILLKEGDCLIVNSRQLHYGYSRGQKECLFLCILVHPLFFSGNITLYERYIRPFTESDGTGFLYFPHRAQCPGMDTQDVFSDISRLLEKKSYNHITIQEIIDEANIGRSTFYAHFETKDDLLRAKCTDLFEHVFVPDGTEASHAFSRNSTFEEKIMHIPVLLATKRAFCPSE